MSSLRAAAARTRTFNPFQNISSSFHRTITTARNDTQSDRGKRPDSFPSPLVDNAPGWNEDLATPSEAVVKADREKTTIDQMKQKTVDYAQWRREQHATNRDPEVEPTHATYAREEIGGPLGSAGMGEFEGVVGHDDLGPDDVQVEANGRVVTRHVVHEKMTVRESGGAGQANI